METQDDHAPLEPRLANTDDLVSLCRLIDTSPENFAKVKAAMLKLPDGAVRDVNSQDFDECLVVRVGDEFVVDLMRQACGIRYEEASKDVAVAEVAGVKIPFANPQLLWKTKQTHREKDALDRTFLAELLKKKGTKP